MQTIMENLKKIILSKIDFNSIVKGNGIYETSDIKAENGNCISIGVSYEDLDDKNDAYVYNIFNGGNNGEYIYISETGDINDKLPSSVLIEMCNILKKYNIKLLEGGMCMTEEMYEELKKAVWNSGVEAIDDLLGYEHDVEEDSSVTEYRIDEVLDQMPEDIILEFYNKYCKNK